MFHAKDVCLAIWFLIKHITSNECFLKLNLYLYLFFDTSGEREPFGSSVFTFKIMFSYEDSITSERNT